MMKAARAVYEKKKEQTYMYTFFFCYRHEREKIYIKNAHVCFEINKYMYTLYLHYYLPYTVTWLSRAQRGD